MVTNDSNTNSDTNRQSSQIARIEELRMELQNSSYKGTSEFFASLQYGGSGETRQVCMDQLVNACRRDSDLVPLTTVQQWTQQEPENKDAHLLHGTLLVARAWGVLRETNTDKSKEELFEGFQKQLRQAERALKQAIDLDPTDPLPYAHMLTATRDLTKLKAIFETFKYNCEDPHNLMVHEVMLHRLTPHWGGTVKELLQFARSATTMADDINPPPHGHPLWSLLAKAHILVWEEQKKAPGMDASIYWKDMAVRKEIVKSYRKYRKQQSYTNNVTSSAERICSNIFAFALWKCKAYSEAHPEFQTIGDAPLEDPWNKESHKHWGQVYGKARGKVQSRVLAKKKEPMSDTSEFFYVDESETFAASNENGGRRRSSVRPLDPFA